MKNSTWYKITDSNHKFFGQAFRLKRTCEFYRVLIMEDGSTNPFSFKITKKVVCENEIKKLNGGV